MPDSKASEEEVWGYRAAAAPRAFVRLLVSDRLGGAEKKTNLQVVTGRKIQKRIGFSPLQLKWITDKDQIHLVYYYPVVT